MSIPVLQSLFYWFQSGKSGFEITYYRNCLKPSNQKLWLAKRYFTCLKGWKYIFLYKTIPWNNICAVCQIFRFCSPFFPNFYFTIWDETQLFQFKYSKLFEVKLYGLDDYHPFLGDDMQYAKDDIILHGLQYIL